MEFRTIVTPSISENKIDYASKSFMIGSCFIENIGEKLIKLGFNSLVNPFGVQYNPISIANVFDRIIHLKEIDPSELFLHNELYHHYDFHGDFSKRNKQLMLQEINKNIRETHSYLTESNFLFITFGTSFAFFNKDTNHIVGNCHKVPAYKFERKIISYQEMNNIWETTIEKIKQVNPNIQIVLTVSPIRHVSDGAEMNQLSKASLILLCHSLRQSFENVNYFASYEILMDDLRDYRFYASDMVHVNQTAIDYIFDKFTMSYISEKSYGTMKKINNLQKDINHKPINIQSEDYLKFLQKRIQLIDDLKLEVDSDELNRLKEKISIIFENIEQSKQ